MILGKKALSIYSNVFSFLPAATQAVFPSELTTTVGVVMTGIAAGINIFKDLNNDFFQKYIDSWDAMELFDDQIKSPEYIQYFKTLLETVAYESRLKKRQHFLNIAINYHRKHSKTTFDEKIKFIKILESLSEEELIYFLDIYSNDHFHLGFKQDNQKLVLAISLRNLGLINQNIEQTQKALEKIKEDMDSRHDAVTESLNNLSDKLSNGPSHFSTRMREPITRYHPFSDKIERKFDKNNFGKKFFDFITTEKSKLTYKKPSSQ